MKKRSRVRRVSLFVLISLSVVLLTFVLMKKFACAEQVQPSAVNELPEKTDISLVEEKTDKVKVKAPVKKSVKAAKSEKPRKTAGFKNNDEIKQEYGKIETVYLYSGEVYTGAVVQNDAEKYTIVTVGGAINIPMSEVKMRSIIK